LLQSKATTQEEEEEELQVITHDYDLVNRIIIVHCKQLGRLHTHTHTPYTIMATFITSKAKEG
jgi:hypothetical protein